MHRLANKLTMEHIMFEQQKMKVKLATQALSSSVAHAIEYCTQVLKLPQFEGSEATVAFIRVIDRLFDILNSKNPLAKGFKAPMKMENHDEWSPFLKHAHEYIFSLKNSSGQFMHRTKQKTGFVGFLCAIESVKGIFEEYVMKPGSPLDYLLNYKFSQDHLELLFSSVRAGGGSNDNPTAKQFTAIYKRLFMRSSIGGSSRGNCTKMDDTNILHIMDDVCKVGEVDMTLSDVSLIRRYDLDSRKPMESTEDLSEAPTMPSDVLSEFKQAIVPYIAGSAGRMTAKSSWCKVCTDALGSKHHICETLFIKQKDRGGLFKPSVSVIKICEETERKVQRMLNTTGGRLPQGKGVIGALETAVLWDLQETDIFSGLNDHMLDTSITDNHVYQLIKTVTRNYCKIRFYHLGKEFSRKLSGQKVRHKLTKLIHQKHQ